MIYQALPPSFQKRYSEEEWVENTQSIFIKFYKTLVQTAAQKGFGKFPMEHPSENTIYKNICYGVAFFHTYSLQNLPKTSWAAVPENKFDIGTDFDDCQHECWQSSKWILLLINPLTNVTSKLWSFYGSFRKFC